MCESDAPPIGGYFELELPKADKFPYPDALRFQSARAAFLTLLRVRKPKRVWLPNYICDAMVEPLLATEIECVWYELDSNLAVNSQVHLAEDDLLVYVNYFGLHNKNVDSVLSRFQSHQILLDYSQAFFEVPPEGAPATLYSPRKFFGVPDGGLLAGCVGGVPALERDIESLDRAVHLMKRLAGTPEDGYVDYQNAEKSLSNCEPKRMSQLTESILRSADFEGVRQVRHENFIFLHGELEDINLFAIDETEVGAPLCYPFVTDDPALRERLIAHRIFIPIYWPDALARVGDIWAERMIKRLLPLPIDQRYGHEDMKRIVSIIRGHEI